jgi:hypothetical protein
LVAIFHLSRFIVLCIPKDEELTDEEILSTETTRLEDFAYSLADALLILIQLRRVYMSFGA